MTDKEIIKALGKISLGGHFCMKCKYKISKGDDRCGIKGCNIAANAIDLINRQQAEIERLTVNKNAYGLGMQRLAEQLETAKSEAIKEFAERLKATDTADLVGEQYINGEIYGYFYSDAFERKIDNLVKKMTE